MPNFRYKALTAAGETVEGVMEAANQAAVVERLRHLGQLPLRADPAAVGLSARLGGVKLTRRRRLGSHELVLFTRQLATLLGAAIPLDQALTLTLDTAPRLPLSRFITRLRERLRGGDAFSAALSAEKEVIPAFYVSMVRAGEAGGTLPETLSRLAGFLEETQVVREQVRSALLYPAILLVVSIFSIGLFMTMVLPRFASLFADAGVPLPRATQSLLFTSNFLAEWGVLLLLALLLVLLLLRHLLSRPAFRLAVDTFRLRLPILGELERKIETARLARTVSALARNGVPLATAISIGEGTLANGRLRMALLEALEGLKQGHGLADPLAHTGAFSSFAIQFVAVGERSGELSAMLIKLADIFEAEIHETVKRLMTLLVPVLTIGSALIVALVFGSILTALFSVYDLAH